MTVHDATIYTIQGFYIMHALHLNYQQLYYSIVLVIEGLIYKQLSSHHLKAILTMHAHQLFNFPGLDLPVFQCYTKTGRSWGLRLHPFIRTTLA